MHCPKCGRYMLYVGDGLFYCPNISCPDYLKNRNEDGKLIEEEPRRYKCSHCGYEQTFEEAYADSGKFCPKCDAKLDIPFSFWKK